MDNNEAQMTELFEEGGIADDGMRVDPVSGNEIPPGSMASEVRDDVPAQLSEGEYVVPADVLRFYGVKFFEDLRSEAKQGMMKMEADGRIGGEPVPAGGPQQEAGGLGQDMDALTPEEMAVLQEMGMAVGGMVPQTNEPSPVAVGNVGYSLGGLENGINAVFDPREFGRGSSIYGGQGTAFTPVSTVILYGPDGLTSETFSLPAQQTQYDARIAEGWSSTQVAVTTETSVGQDPNDEDYGGGGDTESDTTSIGDMNGAQLDAAQKQIDLMRENASNVPSKILELAIKGMAKLQQNALDKRVKELNLKKPTGSDHKGNATGASYATQDIAGIAQAKAMSEDQVQEGITYAATGDDRDDSWDGGQVVTNQTAPDTDRTAEEVQAAAQDAADEQGVTLAPGGKAEGGFVSKRSNKKKKK